MDAKDFTLKFEVKVEGSGGTGLQYRSRTGLPWLANISAAVTAYNGPVNLAWMMTGPQADFWPVHVYTGQFYSENTTMRIIAWRGQMVATEAGKKPRLLGTLGSSDDLKAFIKPGEWNQYEIIADGNTLIHIVNGHVMAVLVDTDPKFAQAKGLIAFEIEGGGDVKISHRNVWLKKLP